MTDLDRRSILFHINKIVECNERIAKAEETAESTYEREYNDQPKYPVVYGVMSAICLVNTRIIETQIEEIKNLIEKM